MTNQRIRLRIDRLQVILRENQLSQNHWAIKLGLSRGHWSDIVNGKHPYPSPKTRERLLEVLGIPFEQLFVVEDGRTDSEAAFKSALRDRYLVDREVGQGGMGTVFLARDIRHGRSVAIKMVSAEAVAGIGAKQFLKEIRTTARLQHHNVLPLYDSGVAADSPFYVMPYIKGGSLRDLLSARGRLNLDETLTLVDGIAQALSHAHESQILHCDIKPENVLLSGSHPFVADFGISRAIHAEVLEWGIRTDIDSSAGTPAYVSPEQASGEQNLDGRSDVYSLACMMFEMLSGRPPFKGVKTMEVVAQRFTTEVPDVRRLAPNIPHAVADELRRAMSLNPQRRPKSVATFVADIRRAQRSGWNPTGFVARSLSKTWSGFRGVGRLFGMAPGGLTMESIITDLKFSLRSFKRRPSFAVTAVLTVALGIGAFTAMFSIVNAVLLRPLEYPDAKSVVSIYPSYPELMGHPTLGPLAERGTFSWPEIFALREQQTSFVAVAAYRARGGILSGEGRPERVSMAEATFELFQILGVTPLLGRVFGPDDDPRVRPVALLTAGFWRERFASDSVIIGKTVLINDQAIEIVGVLPDNFRVGTLRARIWIPRNGSPVDPGIGNHNITGAIGRLSAGASLDQASDEVGRILRVAVPPEHATHGGSVFMRLEDETRNSRTPLLALIGGSFLLLAVGCGNVAAILLGAGIAREQELAVRGALGAGRGRIIRQLLTESVLLSVLGGIAGVAMSVFVMRSLLSIAPRGLPRIETANIDVRVMIFGLVVATLAGIMFGLVPAVGLSKTDLGRVVSSSRGHSGAKTRVHAAVVVGELALATVLMISGALLTRSLFALNRVDPGFDSDELLAMSVAVPFQRFRADDTGDRLNSYFQVLVDEIRSEPTVVDVAITSNTPLTGDRGNNTLLPEGWPDGPDTGILAERRYVSLNYLEVIRAPIVEGRGFNASDLPKGRRTIVVTRALADQAWPDESPLGKRIRHSDSELYTVVGIVGAVRDEWLDLPTTLAFYIPYAQVGSAVGGLIIRTAGDPAESINAIRERVWSVYPDIPITRVTPVSQLMGDSIAQERYRARLMMAFAVLAAIFTTIGIYGVTSRSVGQRSREIAIRMALGAEQASVLAMVLRQGLTIAAIGGVLGILLSFLVTRSFKELLYEVTVFDPITLAGIVLFVGVVSLIASLPPARRATKTDPMAAMRME